MKVVIIGAVAGGMATAAKLKRNNKEVEVVVYEKGEEVSYGACGLPFYISDIIKNDTDLYARSIEDFIHDGIDLHIYHEVIEVNSDEKKVKVKNTKTGKSFWDSYDNLVIASGASVNNRGVLNHEADNYFGIRQVADAYQVKQGLQSNTIEEVVVIGAGFIGIEMLEPLLKYKKKVTLIQREERIFLNVDWDIADKVEQIIKDKGVTVHTDANLLRFNTEGKNIHSVVIEKDGQEMEINAQLVLNCAGITPNTKFITNIDKAPNGAIKVNEAMETSIPGIYSAGDCSIMKSAVTKQYEYAPLGTNANKQGRIIADILGGKMPKPFKLLQSMALKLFDFDVGCIGLTEEKAKQLDIPYLAHTITGNSYAGYYSHEKVTIKVIYDPTSRKILGVQCIGQGTVVPRANYYAVAIYSGLTVDEMGMMDFAYSPPFNGVWDVAQIASNTIK